MFITTLGRIVLGFASIVVLFWGLGLIAATEHFNPSARYFNTDGLLALLSLQSTDSECDSKEDSRYWSFGGRNDSSGGSGGTPSSSGSGGVSQPSSSQSTSSANLTDILQVLTWVVIIIGSIFLLYLLFLALSAFSRRRVVVNEAGSVTESVGVETEKIIQSGGALQAAEELAAIGDYRGALRLLYLSVLHKLSLMGLIDRDENRTNWELLRLLQQRGHRQVHGILLPVTRLFDRAWYGEVAISSSEYREAYDATSAILRSGDSR